MQPFIVNDRKLRKPLHEGPGKNSGTPATYRPGGGIDLYILQAATGRSALENKAA